ncbi:MAG: dihydroneopterin aldolase [Pseudomonadota bacterium]|nr:dihydroneopterin aldolase [Pseudomonadota bacterium]
MTEARYTLVLDGLELMIRIGIHPHEEAPQRIIVGVRIEVTYSAQPEGDRIDEAMDYDFVRAGIRDLAATRRFALQETLCEAIAALCLADRRVERVTVRTTKPDVYPDAMIGCEIVRAR